MAIGNDADFSVITGEACLQLTEFTITVKQKRHHNQADIKNVIIATGWSSTMERICGYLGSNVGTYKVVELPLLDGITDLRTHCLIAVLFANDTFPKELKRDTFFKDMGPTSICDMMLRV
jgi:hypothetical protein